MVLYPTYARPVGMDIILRTRNYSGMHPTMVQRVHELLEGSGGRVGWGQGVRTPQQQLQLFLERHDLDPNGKITFNGQRYTHARGPAALPPGQSMHEVGLAADLAGDFDWLGKNCASFGLQTFANVNNEPWHVQPAELPRGRHQYEKEGAVWGAFPAYSGGPAVTPTAGGPAVGGPSAGGPAGPGPGTAPVDAGPPMLTPALVARVGDTGPAARLLMEALIACSLREDAPTSRDSSYGPDDQQLVLMFQNSNGLKVDGEVGPQTWGKLLATVKPGDSGPMVRVLQTALIVRSLIRDNGANLDGVYGSATQARVQEFQKVSGIDPVATIGPQTWTALLGVKRMVNLGNRGDDTEEIDLDDLDFLAALTDQPAE